MFATIASGHADLADVCFLLAVIFAGILAVVSVVRSNLEAALLPTAVALVALGWLVL
jgi:hypothetical protein